MGLHCAVLLRRAKQAQVNLVKRSLGELTERKTTIAPHNSIDVEAYLLSDGYESSMWFWKGIGWLLWAKGEVQLSS